MQKKHPLIVGITGASGAIYGIRILQKLKAADIPSHLVISKAAHLTISDETNHTLDDIKALADTVHQTSNIGASIASGSFKTMGMVIAPCSMRTLGEIASGVTSSLISRAADVALKERRPLVLMPRETPLNLIHLRNMTAAIEAGAIIAPPVPAFYQKPETLNDIIDHTTARVLDLFGIEDPELKRWNGISS